MDDATIIWTDEQCFRLNASQHDHTRHGYTCGAKSSHRPLVATRQGWRCADCDYRQAWVYGIEGKPPEEAAVFRVGDAVSKSGGDYTFDGHVVSVFRKRRAGVTRYVVEDDRGILHVFNESQIKAAPREGGAA